MKGISQQPPQEWGSDLWTKSHEILEGPDVSFSHRAYFVTQLVKNERYPPAPFKEQIINSVAKLQKELKSQEEKLGKSVVLHENDGDIDLSKGVTTYHNQLQTHHLTFLSCEEVLRLVQ